MANTITLNSVNRDREQFAGMFTDVWKVKATVVDTDAVALTDTLALSLTVPGVVLGDMVLGISTTLDHSDGTDFAVVRAIVSAADTVQVLVTADVGEFAADALNAAVVKILVGRPNW